METIAPSINRAKEFCNMLFMDSDPEKLLAILTEDFEAIVSAESQNLVLNKKELEKKLKLIYSKSIKIEYLNEPSYLFQENGSVQITSNCFLKQKSINSEITNLYDLDIILIIYFSSDKPTEISRIISEYNQVHLGHELSQTNTMDYFH